MSKAEAKVDSTLEEQVEIKASTNETANATDTNSTDSSDSTESSETEKDDTKEADDAEAEESKDDSTAKSDDSEQADAKQYETKLVKKVHRVSLDTNFTAVDLVVWSQTTFLPPSKL